MIQRVFSVYDMKSEAYMPPFFAPTSASAIRSFSDAVHKDGSVFNKHPEDFVLYEIGTFSEQSGELMPCKHRGLGKGVEMLALNDVQPAPIRLKGLPSNSAEAVR